MRISQSNSRHGIQRLYYLAILTSLVALAIFAAGCGNQTPMSTNQGAVQPSPSPKGNHGRVLGETPIIISGGSLQLDFPKKQFSDPGGGTFTIGEPLAAGFVYDNNPDGKAKDINLSDYGNLTNCDIIISYLVKGDLTPKEMLTIASRETPTTTIKFNGDLQKFESRATNGYSQQYFVRGDQYRIAHIKVKYLRSDGTPTDEKVWTIENGLGKNGKVGIELFGQKVR